MIKIQKSLRSKLVSMFGFIPVEQKIRMSKKLLSRWFGPYRIIEKSSPVHFRLCTDTNKKVTFAVHANKMKPFVDPSLRPIDPPPSDDPSQLCLDDAGIPEDCLVVDSPVVDVHKSNEVAASRSVSLPQNSSVDN